MRLPRLIPGGRAAALALLAAGCAPRPAARPAHAAAPATDQPGPALTGIVRDDQSDAPVAGAWVIVFADTAPGARGLAGMRTDGRGVYRLSGLPMGRYVVRVRHPGYLAESRRVQIGDCGVVVQAHPGGPTSHCTDHKNVYLAPATRF